MNRLLCWQKIEKDGYAFEQIIEELLKVMFPLEEYTHTPKTRDGGKDFVCITKSSDEYWAECKNYSDALATSDIAKTFVMAIAEDVKKVMIFSVSPFTDIAIREINSFTEKIQYEVKLYDGDALNAIMLQYIKEIDLPYSFKNDFFISNPVGESCIFSYISRNNYNDNFSP
ncbi:MAG: restriction endonuclease, partial [Lachnospiraceae bacterium]|nr:restriction endonuclease [Lachnospiraceae bacterium]